MANKIFSGIRPSGKLHLGNYLGAIKNWIELQHKTDTEQAIYAVVDLHGITTPFNPKDFRQQVMDVILDYLAAGINPEKSILMRQSKVPAHTELAWIFNTITPVGWLDRLPTYKEKQEQIEGSDNPKSESWKNNTGILDYPVLMASDILVYKSNLVPIGDDQKAHLDLTNEIVKKFNFMFGETFEPVKALKGEGARIMSLQDPTKKMSKTGDEGVALSDSPDVVRAKIKKAVTDSGNEIKFDKEGKPAISNLLTIYHLLSDKDIDDIEKDYDGKSYADFKSDLAEVVISFLEPFQEKRAQFAKDPTKVEEILAESEEKARVIANSTLTEVKEKMGLI
ncbi:MAG: tryptophan--tRNA ligase [Candidatus Paceibacterota bacterium]